eukprot:TRINITY_DN30586_c0_g1_i1.p1 TRINITY_DN30586_c0_g1~~TRINITY_DN30586_c0_g1_i1.p1  ORF type:complete len:315 (+),score=117.71 TRINITY_DN30586_c0_g1_i1:49-993(+)
MEVGGYPQLWQAPAQAGAAVSPGASPGAGGAIYPAAATSGASATAPRGGYAQAAFGSPGAGAALRQYGAQAPAPPPPQHNGDGLYGGGSPQAHDAMKLRVFEQRLADLEARLGDVEQRDEASWRAVNGQVDKLREAVDTQQKTHDVLDERKAKELQLLESTLQVELGAEKQERREVETCMLRQIDERLSQLREDVVVDVRRREDGLTQRHDEISTSIESLGAKIDRTRQLGDDRCAQVASMLREEVARLSNMLGMERKLREETESTMCKMLEDMCIKLEREIERERRERERAEEGLLRLLDDTCSRVETSLRHH